MATSVIVLTRITKELVPGLSVCAQYMMECKTDEAAALQQPLLLVELGNQSLHVGPQRGPRAFSIQGVLIIRKQGFIGASLVAKHPVLQNRSQLSAHRAL